MENRPSRKSGIIREKLKQRREAENKNVPQDILASPNKSWVMSQDPGGQAAEDWERNDYPQFISIKDLIIPAEALTKYGKKPNGPEKGDSALDSKQEASIQESNYQVDEASSTNTTKVDVTLNNETATISIPIDIQLISSVIEALPSDTPISRLRAFKLNPFISDPPPDLWQALGHQLQNEFILMVENVFSELKTTNIHNLEDLHKADLYKLETVFGVSRKAVNFLNKIRSGQGKGEED